ncbi:MAG TPA: lysoplasmalogenase [Candidatus Angelobacter sp.]|nr:lysoplasmalogenase [Candidatus Angelobacter sp.]
MNTPAWIAFALAALASAGNLTAILRHDKRLEYATKPTVMVLLIAAALLMRPASQGERALFVVALMLGLAGDVLLMLPDDYLVAGIGAFLAGHVAYVVGFRFAGFNTLGLLAGVIIAAATARLFLRTVLGALPASGRDKLQNPVLAYAIVISLMTVSATASGNLVAAAGGLLFFFSDVIFAWYRFVKPVRWGQPVNIVMYQAGQALLVLSLALGG